MRPTIHFPEKVKSLGFVSEKQALWLERHIVQFEILIFLLEFSADIIRLIS